MKIIGHSDILGRLRKAISADRIAHAYLFTGPPGVGKLPVALWYAQLILTKAFPEQLPRARSLEHPDMHFFFPVAAAEKIKKHAVSKWRSFLSGSPYGDLYDWYRHLGVEKKQGKIGVNEAREVVKQLALKPFLSNYKVFIVWQADQLNDPAANKLLKVLEEPPDNVVFILIADNPGELLPTLVSRVQKVIFKPLPAHTLSEALQADGVESDRADWIAYQAQGSYRSALQLSVSVGDTARFERWFILWIRNAFKALKNPKALRELIAFADELYKWSRDEQKQFLSFSTAVFRQAFLRNYDLPTPGLLELKSGNFKFESFCTYVKAANVAQILHELNEAFYHIERNVNGKMVFLDMSVKMARLLHAGK